MSSRGMSKVNISSVLKPPAIKRKHLRKYSWLPDVFRIKGSIIGRIIGPVLTVTLFASLIAYLFSQGYRVALTNSVTPMLSVVVGLILVFRNGTSYDRYWEGRKSFASITSQVRNLSRQIWINAALPPTDQAPPHIKGKTPTSSITATQLRRRKADALRLSVLFVYAVKHYVRGEDGLNWEDYRDILPAWFLRYAEPQEIDTYASTRNNSLAPSIAGDSEAGSSPEGTLRPSRADATKRVRPKRSKPRLAGPTTPLLARSHQVVDFALHVDDATLPLPLIVAYELNRLLFEFRREGFLETVGPAGTNAMSQLIQGMIDNLTAMERVANTPIPISYGIHLKQCVTLYLFALPMTLVKELGWTMVPIITVVAFTFMGIEGIADEIEMPFGHDTADLPLDRYCQDLKEEINFMIERLPESGEGVHGYDDGEGDD